MTLSLTTILAITAIALWLLGMPFVHEVLAKEVESRTKLTIGVICWPILGLFYFGHRLIGIM